MKGKPVIVIATQGFVFCGIVMGKDEEFLTLTDAKVVRKWGTKRGLGQLALEGRTTETVFDVCGQVSIARKAVVAVLECKKPL